MHRLHRWTLVPLLVVALLLASPAAGWAASGGRMGGSNFGGGRSYGGGFRSSPSLPRSYGGGSYRGGYGGGYGGGFGGGGFGFPFLIPIFGFGGGGLFGFLVLMAVVGLLVNAVRGAGGGGALADAGAGSRGAMQASGEVSLAQVQVGLLASARQLQQDLRDLAARADTGSSAGLATVLQESTLALLRHPDLWVYASAEVGQVPFSAAESTFNRLSMAERSKLEREVTVNVAGRRSSDSAESAGASDATSEFIAVTLLVASRSRLQLPAAASAEALRQGLQVLGAVASDDLLALEVIWQPEGAGEVLSSTELLTAHPQLQHL